MKVLKVNCQTCGQAFQIEHWRLKKNPKYCSRNCYYEARKGSSVSPQTEFKKGNIPWNKGKRGYGLNNPDLTPTSSLAYILGVLKGDGCCYQNKSKKNAWIISLQVRNRDFAQKYKSALININLNPYVYYNKSNNQWCVEKGSNTFGEWYRSLSLGNLEEIVKGYEVCFLKGFFDSEGSYFIMRDRNYIKPFLSIVNTDQYLMKLVAKLFKQLGFGNKLYRRKPSGLMKKDQFRLTFAWGTAKKVYEMLSGVKCD